MRRKGRLLDALDQVGPVEAVRRQAGLGVACVELKLRAPHAVDATLARNCICSLVDFDTGDSPVCCVVCENLIMYSG